MPKISKSKTSIQKLIKQRNIYVEYADDKELRYFVIDRYESKIVQEPTFFNFKKYYGNMISMLLMITNIIIINDKWFVVLACLVASSNLFLWMKSYIESLENYKNNFTLYNLFKLK